MAEEKYLAGYTEGWWQEAAGNRVLIRKYNTIDPLDLNGKFEILTELLGSVYPDTIIEPPFHCDNGKNIYLGKGFYANYNFTVLDADRITIGDHVVIAPNVTICAASHPIHHESRNAGAGYPVTTAPITIGNNVWIGAGTTIMMGVTIGDNTVVGAHSLVTKDIPSDVVAFGSPCRVVREITDDDRHEWVE